VGALLVVLAFVLGQGRGGDDEPAAGSTPGQASGSPEASASEESSAVTQADLTQFATAYVQTAAADPEAGFEMLTPDYQDASGGLKGYLGFWGAVTDVPSFRVTGTDLGDTSVTYDYSYVRGGRTTEEVVTLLLEQQDDGSFLISGTG
jgi:hypothetical protein